MTDTASSRPRPASSPDAIAAFLRGLDPAYAPTPLRTLPALARTLGVAQVLAKDESVRTLGSFKSLGAPMPASWRSPAPPGRARPISWPRGPPGSRR